jgi:hypothetical protein
MSMGLSDQRLGEHADADAKADMLLDYEDVLFLGGTCEHDVSHIAMRLVVGSSRETDAEMMDRIVAVLGLLHLSGRRGQTVASDLLVRGTLPKPDGSEYSEFEAFLQDNRVIRWEDQLASLLDSGAVTMAGIKRASHNHTVSDFLSQRRPVKKAR